MLISGSNQRYAISAQAGEKLRRLGESMDMNREKPDKEWEELHDVLVNEDMKNTEGVFRAVESFTKGKKSLKNDPVRQKSVDLALDALAIVSAEGDDVAKAEHRSWWTGSIRYGVQKNRETKDILICRIAS